MVYKQTKKTVDRKLCTAQHGFHQKHSTVPKLLLYCDKLYQASDDISSPITVYLDIAKAFDTINFNIVLQKLARFGFDERFLKFFASYLFNRQHRVKIEHCYSPSSKNSSGGHQGSIFAVFLFSVYINDLINILMKHSFMPMIRKK